MEKEKELLEYCIKHVAELKIIKKYLTEEYEQTEDKAQRNRLWVQLDKINRILLPACEAYIAKHS